MYGMVAEEIVAYCKLKKQRLSPVISSCGESHRRIGSDRTVAPSHRTRVRTQQRSFSSAPASQLISSFLMFYPCSLGTSRAPIRGVGTLFFRFCHFYTTPTEALSSTHRPTHGSLLRYCNAPLILWPLLRVRPPGSRRTVSWSTSDPT